MMPGLNPKKMKGEFASHIKKDMKTLKKYAHADIYEEMEKNFTEENFLKTTKNALEHIGQPMLTVEHIFHGKLAGGPRKQILGDGRTIIQLEPTSFLSFRYPHMGAKIICELIKKIDTK